MGKRILRLSAKALGDAVVMALQPQLVQHQPPLPEDTKVLNCRVDLLGSFFELELQSESWSEEFDGDLLYLAGNTVTDENDTPVMVLTAREQTRKPT